MITVKILDRQYQVPNSYSELTIDQLDKLTGVTDPLEQIKVFIPDRALDAALHLNEVYGLAFEYLSELPVTGTPPETITLNETAYPFYSDVSRVKVMSVFQMDKLLSMDKPFPYQLRWGAAIILQQLTTDKQDDNTADGLIQYTGQLSVQVAWDILQWFITGMPKLYEGHPTPRLTPEERQANTADLERYGMWGAMFQLANSDLEKMAYLWQRPIGEVVMAQGYSTAQSQYEKRYAEILRK